MKKLRHLHQKHRDPSLSDQYTLQDVTNLLISLSKPAAKLELDNSLPAYKVLRDGLKDADNMIKEMRNRLRLTIYQEIKEDMSKRKKKNPIGMKENLVSYKKK